jgi:hypothetical protein
MDEGFEVTHNFGRIRVSRSPITSDGQGFTVTHNEVRTGGDPRERARGGGDMQVVNGCALASGRELALRLLLLLLVFVVSVAVSGPMEGADGHERA